MAIRTAEIEHPLDVAEPGEIRSLQLAILAIVILTVLRFATAAYLPLSFDEAYFWLWSKHLALSYYDHPPLIAFAIRLGTLVFGDTEFGVRAVSLAAAVGASWAVWRAAAILLTSETAGATACLFFNATLMVASQAMGATPDALVMAGAAFLLFALAKLQVSGDGRWWIAAGCAVGIALLAKYTALFLGAGVAVWLVGSSHGRAWLKSPWPYAAGILAVALLVPNLVWNAAHDWVSFRFQFGRIVEGAPTFTFLLEFVAGQFLLASPFILALAIAGLALETRLWTARTISIPAAMVWPALAYFLIHAIHDRVQGNWPSFIYPALAILAASVIQFPTARRNRFVAVSRMLALPVAAIILVGSYLQTWTGLMPLGKQDPIARMMAVGIRPVADEISSLAARKHAVAIVTSKYATAGWMAFYLAPAMPVIEMSEEQRWLEVPRANAKVLRMPLLYVTQNPQHELQSVAALFSKVTLEETLVRSRNGAVIDKFYVYSLSGFHGSPAGRIVNAIDD
jgi:4-amino-4-deoxy-L-arabinose transferase-like glycosyltransferase